MSTSASSGLVCIDLGISIYTQRHCNALCCAALCGVHTDSVLLDTIHPFVLIDPFVPIYPFVLCRTTQRTRSCSCVRLWWCACLAQQAPPPPTLLVFPTQESLSSLCSPHKEYARIRSVSSHTDRALTHTLVRARAGVNYRRHTGSHRRTRTRAPVCARAGGRRTGLAACALISKKV